MSANELLERLKSASPGSPLDWKQARDQITSEYGGASATERVTLLQIYKIMMDAVERGLSGADLATFRTAREQDYNLMLISECVDGAGNVRPDAMRAVTEREVTAGRMAQDSELRRLAVAGPKAFQPLPEAPRKGLRGLFGRGHRSK